MSDKRKPFYECGYAETNCIARPACSKYADNYWTDKCTIDKSSPAKSVNCGWNHSSNRNKYESYLKRLEMCEKRKEKNIKNHQVPFCFLIKEALFLWKKSFRDFNVKALKMVWNVQKSGLEKKVRMDACACVRARVC